MAVMLNAIVLLAQESQPAKPSGGMDPMMGMLLPMIAIFALFYFLIILPARRKEKQQREALFGNLKKNDEVLTSAGIIGVVASIKDDEVTLKLEDNAKMRVLKSTLVKIMNAKDAASTTPAATDNAANVKAGAPGTPTAK
jgi:preprotein translocase subunit YajC